VKSKCVNEAFVQTVEFGCPELANYIQNPALLDIEDAVKLFDSVTFINIDDEVVAT